MRSSYVTPSGMSSRSAHIPKAANSRRDFGRPRGCSATCTSTLVPSVSLTSSSGLKTPSSYLAAMVTTFALPIQGYQDGQLGAPVSSRPHEDLVAKLVAMAIDLGAIPWNQRTPAARRCLKRRLNGCHGRPALALIIRWSKVQILQGPPASSNDFGLSGSVRRPGARHNRLTMRMISSMDWWAAAISVPSKMCVSRPMRYA